MSGQQDWADDALCAQIGYDLFFAEQHEGSRDAKRICRSCPVLAECLEWALRVESREPDSHGVFGGMSARERRNLIARGRRQEAAA